MFSEGEGLNSPVKFAVAAAYDKFAARWEMVGDKLHWVDVWAPLLERFSVQEINAAVDYCAKEFRRPPVPVELIELATRVRTGRPLSEPIVSLAERMAYLILTSDEFAASNATLSDIRDACMIAASVAYLKEYDAVRLDTSEEFRLVEFGGRARMFMREAIDWHKDAREGKGYWKDAFNP